MLASTLDSRRQRKGKELLHIQSLCLWVNKGQFWIDCLMRNHDISTGPHDKFLQRLILSGKVRAYEPGKRRITQSCSIYQQTRWKQINSSWYFLVLWVQEVDSERASWQICLRNQEGDVLFVYRKRQTSIKYERVVQDSFIRIGKQVSYEIRPYSIFDKLKIYSSFEQFRPALFASLDLPGRRAENIFSQTYFWGSFEHRLR